jgi:hypothetical protein
VHLDGENTCSLNIRNALSVFQTDVHTEDLPIQFVTLNLFTCFRNVPYSHSWAWIVVAFHLQLLVG